WTPVHFRQALRHPIAVDGFESDRAGLEWCDRLVLLLPCGRSAHLEAGWAAGSGRPVHVLLADGEPELMYLLAKTSGGSIHTSPDELRTVLRL
ncbi:MAG: hypothetical protein ACOCUS_00075, partial [Polyangiales bacterium]